jgi:hypothetical protein
MVQVYLAADEAYSVYFVEVGGSRPNCDIPPDKLEWVRKVEAEYDAVQVYLGRLDDEASARLRDARVEQYLKEAAWADTERERAIQSDFAYAERQWAKAAKEARAEAQRIDPKHQAQAWKDHA